MSRKEEFTPVDVFGVDKEKNNKVVEKPKEDPTAIQVRKGFFDGSKPLQEIIAEKTKNEEKEIEKDQTMAYLLLFGIGILFLIFSPHISSYIKRVNQDTIESVKRMPYVTDLTETEARNELKDYEVEVEYIESDSPYYEDGVVIKANVDYGMAMTDDQKVKLYVCTNPSEKAQKLESVVFPKFPVKIHDFMIKSGKLENGIITLTIQNDGIPFKNIFLGIEQYSDMGDQLNSRTFFYKDLDVKSGETFTVSFKLTHPRLKRIAITRIDIFEF